MLQIVKKSLTQSKLKKFIFSLVIIHTILKIKRKRKKKKTQILRLTSLILNKKAISKVYQAQSFKIQHLFHLNFQKLV